MNWYSLLYKFHCKYNDSMFFFEKNKTKKLIYIIPFSTSIFKINLFNSTHSYKLPKKSGQRRQFRPNPLVDS